MFGKLGQIASLLGNMGKIQEEAKKMQESLAAFVAEGEAGGGAVKVQVNGKLEVVRCDLSQSTNLGGDRELLEDLIKAATNQAIAKVMAKKGEEMTKMAAGMGLPPGINLPGM